MFTRLNGAEKCDGHNACTTTYVSDQIAGLDLVYDLRTTHNIAAVNMSLGGGEFKAACDDIAVATPIATLLAAGIPTVVSTGNASFLDAVGAPACVTATVAVGATTDADLVAGFSNRSALLDLFAPGVDICSSIEEDGYDCAGGTSASAPHVAGAWALMRQAYPGYTTAQILARLQLTGAPIAFEGDLTRSRIDLLAALQPGTIVVRKETVPAGRTGFEFTDDVASPNAFTLGDDGSKTFSGVLPGSYTILESDPGEFVEVSDIACTDPGGGTGSSVRDRAMYAAVGPGETVTCTFTNSDLPPAVTMTPATQTVQYSDRIAEIVLTGRDSDQDALTVAFSHKVGAGAYAAGLPAGLSAAAQGCTTSDGVRTCTWKVNGAVGVAAGSYTLRAVVSDDDASATTATAAVTVQPEAASVRFDVDNPIGVQVAAPGGNSGAFSLRLYVEEAEPDTPAATAAPGDLNLAEATISLVPVGPGGGGLGACVETGLTGTGYAQVLSVRCDFSNVPVNTYAVVVAIGGGYYAGGGEEVVTVYDPSLGFTTGGGWFYWPGTTDRTSVGYTMKYNRKGQNPQGTLLVIRHLADGTSHRIKSNALNSLALGEGGGFDWASFTGKGTYLAPGELEPQGGYEFVAYAEDRGEPGRGDAFWIALRDRNGTLVPVMAMPLPATANAAALERGNISVPHGGN